MPLVFTCYKENDKQFFLESAQCEGVYYSLCCLGYRKGKFVTLAHNTGDYHALVSLFCSVRAMRYKCGLRMSTRRFVKLLIH